MKKKWLKSIIENNNEHDCFVKKGIAYDLSIAAWNCIQYYNVIIIMNFYYYNVIRIIMNF